jgi:hypothetical protein
MNVEFLREQIERCRRLAKHADPFTEKRLLDLAAEYEARIFEIEKGYRPSPASRLLKPVSHAAALKGPNSCAFELRRTSLGWDSVFEARCSVPTANFSHM